MAKLELLSAIREGYEAHSTWLSTQVDLIEENEWVLRFEEKEEKYKNQNCTCKARIGKHE